MAFDNLSDKLSAVFKKLRSRGKLTESDVKSAMREVRLALLEADVNYKVAKDFTNSLTEKCVGEKVLESLTAPQWYKGTANAIYQNLEFIDRYDPEYVIILSGDHIYKMDYSKMLD